MKSMENTKLNRLIHSAVALTLLVVLLFTVTYSWLTNQMTAQMNASDDYITIDPGANLEMSYDNEDISQGSIDISRIVREDFAFRECSSYNGKKIYFPLSEYSPAGDGDFQESSTGDFIYRKSTVGDKNSKYLSIDLTLKSKDNVSVWLSEDSGITGGAANAIRVAFIENEPNGNSTVLGESYEGYDDQCSYEAITTLNSNGKPNTQTVHFSPFSYYAYGNTKGNTLFKLEAGVTKHITVNIWLEGTDRNCTEDVVGLNDIQIYFKFSTNQGAEKTFYFVDHTLEKWVDDAECKVFAMYPFGTNADGSDNYNIKEMSMSETYSDDYTWSINLPANTTSVKFARYNPKLQEGKPQEWNYWEAGTVSNCTTYNAIGHSAGIWDDNFQGTTITFFDGSSAHHFIDNRNQHLVHVKYNTTDGNGNPVTLDYKMSYQYDSSTNTDYKRWSIVIPSNVTDNITFDWCANPSNVDNYDPSTLNRKFTWANTNRGNNLYFTADMYKENNNTVTKGYWGGKTLLLNVSTDLINPKDSNNPTIPAAYFFGSNGEIGWSAMNANTAKGRYVTAVPDGATYVIFCKYNYKDYNNKPWDWAGVYNQTYDLTLSANNMFTITGFSNPDADSNEVFCVNNVDGWDTVYCYMWNNDNDKNANWPGVVMTKVNDKTWSYTVTGNWSNIIFNNGGNGKQTADMKYQGKGSYYNNATSTSYLVGNWYTTDDK